MTGELKENLGSQSQAKLDETAKVLDQLEGKMTPDDYTRFANIKDRLGRSVLHLACQHGVNLQIIKDLVEKCGAKTDLEDMEGQEPIDYAVQFDNRECFEYLVQLII